MWAKAADGASMSILRSAAHYPAVAWWGAKKNICWLRNGYRLHSQPHDYRLNQSACDRSVEHSRMTKHKIKKRVRRARKKPGEPRRKKPKPKGRGDAKLAAAFGRNLRRIRTAAGLSQHKLARQVAVSAPTVCNIERGQFSPSLDSLKKLKRGLQISWDVLLKGI